MNALTTTRQARGLPTPTTMGDAMKLAEMLASSTMVPNSYRGKPGDILVAVQMGAELGLAPLQALQNIASINGRPSVWGDAALALVQNHPAYVSHREWVEGEGEDRAGYCAITRRGSAEHVQRFGMRDAKKAGLLGKAGPWSQYTDRMLVLRARLCAAGQVRGRAARADHRRGSAGHAGRARGKERRGRRRARGARAGRAVRDGQPQRHAELHAHGVGRPAFAVLGSRGAECLPEPRGGQQGEGPRRARRQAGAMGKDRVGALRPHRAGRRAGRRDEGERRVSGINKVIILGRLGRDPESRNFQNGGKVVNLRLATSERYKDREGNMQERTEWHSVAIFNEKLGEIAEKYLRKGSEVYIEGALETRKWTDQQGAERYTTEIVLRQFRGELALVGGRQNGDAPAEPQPARGGGAKPGARSSAVDADEIPFLPETRA